jgi:hypothetical protein
MKEFLINNGWIHYASGCPCLGLPRYYKNPAFPDYRIILKGGTVTLRYCGIDKFRTNNMEELRKKMIEYEMV